MKKLIAVAVLLTMAFTANATPLFMASDQTLTLPAVNIVGVGSNTPTVFSAQMKRNPDGSFTVIQLTPVDCNSRWILIGSEVSIACGRN